MGLAELPWAEPRTSRSRGDTRKSTKGNKRENTFMNYFTNPILFICDYITVINLKFGNADFSQKYDAGFTIS